MYPSDKAEDRSHSTGGAEAAEIRVRGVRRSYLVGNTEVRALRGVDLEISQGEFVGVVGVSGSGKSTLLHLIGGLDTEDDGVIEVAGRRLSSMTAYEKAIYRRETIGFVFQAFHLVPNLTAEQNLQLALTVQGIYGEERTKRAAMAIERVGLAHRAQHQPGQLSGGEQQRITVARAIVNHPRVLLADEPTGNLDQATAQSLMNLINELRLESQMTVLMVTHDESLARQYCDRIVRMRDGQFVEEL